MFLFLHFGRIKAYLCKNKEKINESILSNVVANAEIKRVLILLMTNNYNHDRKNKKYVKVQCL